jgi:RNA polymerase sigma factor (sigma-70 family)
MPGFSSAGTENQRAFRDSVRLMEERTGRKYVDTPEKKQKRRKIMSETMYKNSPSVPDSMLQFATEIHQEERITRNEEIELGEKTQEAIRLQHLFQSLEDRLGREPTDDEWCAAAGKINMSAIGQAIEDGLAAKNKLVTSNLRIVQSVVNTYIRNGLSAQYNAGDLMQEGIMALIHAAEKFEPDRGWKFSTYAMYWVRASVKRSQLYQSRIIPVPQRLSENHKRLKRIEREMIAATGRRPSMKELGATVGMTEEQVNRCMTAMAQRCYSLDQEIQNKLKPNTGGGSGETMIEIVESKSSKVHVQNDYDRVERTMLREDLMETLRRYLPPQEAEVLLARYGFISKKNYLSDDETSKQDGGMNSNNNNSKMYNATDEKKVTRSSRSIGEEKPATIAELSRMFNLKPDKVRRMIDNSLKHLNGVGLDEWLAFERDLP